ncbi:MAG: OmpA family protein [Acidobacteria bacterium]|nr:OmpA family protein [Acidobacteriota bacterium]
MTREDQIAIVAPSINGQTGLFSTVTGDTLRRGDLSFGIYFNDWDLLAAPARDFAPLTARRYRDMSYDLYRLSASVGYGITDRWEVSAMLPYDHIKTNGGDRAGFINGYLYQGRNSDSGLGDVKLATKFALLDPATSPNKVALSLFVDLPTGEDNSGISTGNGNFGAGVHWTRSIFTLGGTYVMVGKRNDDKTNYAASGDVDLPNELRADAGLNIPLSFWRTTNWISEANAVFYTGGDQKPKAPLFLVTGIRHWFGDSGWALSAGARWNVQKFSYDNDECRFTELDDCGLSGLVGLTFAPMRLAAAAVPPAPPISLPPPCPPQAPPPPPTPIPPPAPPVAPPRVPTEIRTDEIHFEPASARLTNIAKAILDDVALRMKQEPTATAIVIGYTDNREATGPNQDLDRRRAEAVRDYLVSRHGIDPSRITIEGRDAREPVGDNNTAEGRLKNRRVVIRLMLP